MHRPPQVLSALLASLAVPALLHAEHQILADFEGDDWGDWQVEGNAFGAGPVAGGTGRLEGSISGYEGDGLASSFAVRDDAGTGVLSSPEFEIDAERLSFLVGGGSASEPDQVEVQFLVDGEVVRRADGGRDNHLHQVIWEIAEYRGRRGQVRVVDRVDDPGQWGTIWADHFVLERNAAEAEVEATNADTPPPLSSAPSAAAVQVPRGTDVRIVADTETTGVHDTTSLSVADNGELYVAESGRYSARGVDDNRRRRYWIPTDIASTTLEDRLAMYEKFSDRVPLSYYTEQEESVRRLVDEDGDHIFDSHTIFADGFNAPLDGTATGVFAWENSVYLACIPSVWQLTDLDGDGKAEERDALITGYGIRVSYSGHDLNGFTLGPDGRLYYTVGDRGFNLVSGEGEELFGPGRGACFRIELDGSGLELIHDGLRNPKELAFDDYGNLVSVDNNSDQGDLARVVVIAEGADSGWRMGHQVLHSFHREVDLDEPPPRPWMDEAMWEPANGKQPAHFLPAIENLTAGPAGMVWLGEGSRFPASLRNSFLVCDYRGSASGSGVWHFRIAPEGAGYRVTNSDWLLRGITAPDIDLGPEGGLYLADYMESWSYTGTGRIWRLAGEDNAELAEETRQILNQGFAERSIEELAALCAHPDQRVRFRAIYYLAGRDDVEAAREEFVRLASGSSQLERDEHGPESAVVRLSGVWGLGQLLRRQGDVGSGATLLELCGADDPKVVREAIRAISDNGAGEVADFAPLLRDLIADPSNLNPQVLAEAVRSLADVGNGDDIELLRPLLALNDNADVYLREALVFALTELASTPQLVSLSGDGSRAVRLGAVVALRRQGAPEVAEFLADENPDVVVEALSAINNAPIPEAYDEAAALLDRIIDGSADRSEGQPLMKPVNQWRLINCAFRAGRPEDASRLLRYAAAGDLPVEPRLEAMRRLDQWTTPHPVDQSTGEHHELAERDPSDYAEVFATDLPPLLENEHSEIRAAALRLAPTFGVEIGTGLLVELVTDESMPTPVRRQALDSLVAAEPDSLATVLSSLASGGDADLRGDALTDLIEHEPDSALEQIAALHADSEAPLSLRQRAWLLLPLANVAAAEGQLAEGLSQLESGALPTGEMLELMEAIEASGSEPLVSRLEEYKAAQAEQEVSEPWLVDGGSVALGANVFTAGAAQCAKCHAVGGEGGNAGPDLAGVASRYDHAGLVKALLEPSADIAPGWAVQSIVLADGRRLSGTYHGEDEEHIALELPGGDIRRLPKAAIEQRLPMISAMPPMGALVEDRDLRDIIAYLHTLDDRGDAPGMTHGEESEANEETSTEAAEESGSDNDLSAFDKIPIVDLAELDLGSAVAADNTTPTATDSDEDATDPVAADGGEDKADPALGLDGAALFAAHCAACHQPDGNGLAPVYPPLAGSEWLQRPAEVLSRIVLHGLEGPIEVAGTHYDHPVSVMLPLGETLSDAEIAAVLTHVRSTWGEDNPVTTATVAEAREASAGRTSFWTPEELDQIEGELAARADSAQDDANSIETASSTAESEDPSPAQAVEDDSAAADNGEVQAEPVATDSGKAEADPALGLDGAALFATHCAACHQADGSGLPPIYPPLAGSEWLQRPAEVLARIILHGLEGPIEVAGTSYDNPASIMLPLGQTLSDAEIAAVLTHVRSTWGEDNPVATATVTEAREASAGRTTFWTAEELEQFDEELASSPEPGEDEADSSEAASTMDPEDNQPAQTVETTPPHEVVDAGFDQFRDPWIAGRWSLLGVLLICILGVVVGAWMMQKVAQGPGRKH